MPKRPSRFEYWQSDADHQFYFHFIGGNGEVVSPSEGYTRKSGLIRAIRRFKDGAPLAVITLIKDPNASK